MFVRAPVLRALAAIAATVAVVVVPPATVGAARQLPRVTPLTGAVQVSAGGDHTCAIVPPKGVECWGRNNKGQLGTGAFGGISTAAVTVVGLTRVRQISAGGSHTCALPAGGKTKGEVECWGLNGSGQLGDNSVAASAVPVFVHTSAGNPSPLTGVISISAGGNHTCAVIKSAKASIGDVVKCWGLGTSGQLGNGAFVTRHAPVTVSGLSKRVTIVSAGGAHTCAMWFNGPAWCWGNGSKGQLGNGAIVNHAAPVRVVGLVGVHQISAGGSHSCAVAHLATGQHVKALCWGLNDVGQLGKGAFNAGNACVGNACQDTPVAVVGLPSPPSGVTAGGAHTCAVGGFDPGMTSGSFVECWGLRFDGQLGIGPGANTNQPTLAVPGGYTNPGYNRPSAGANHTCALYGGYVECWGQGNFGQLGDGSVADSPYPSTVQ